MHKYPKPVSNGFLESLQSLNRASGASSPRLCVSCWARCSRDRPGSVSCGRSAGKRPESCGGSVCRLWPLVSGSSPGYPAWSGTSGGSRTSSLGWDPVGVSRTELLMRFWRRFCVPWPGRVRRVSRRSGSCSGTQHLLRECLGSAELCWSPIRLYNKHLLYWHICLCHIKNAKGFVMHTLCGRRMSRILNKNIFAFEVLFYALFWSRSSACGVRRLARIHQEQILIEMSLEVTVMCEWPVCPVGGVLTAI